MMKHTQHTIKTPHRAIVGLLCAFILLFGIGFGIFGENRVEASNVYTSNTKFYEKNDAYFVEFFVNTSFTANYFGAPIFNPTNFIFTTYCDWQNLITPAITCDTLHNTFYYRDCHFIAGNTYKINLAGLTWTGYPYTNKCWTKTYYISQYGAPDSSHYIFYGAVNLTFPFNDTENYYFSETPTLDITFPFENAEISEAFYITGSYTIPENSGITKLIAFFRPVGLPYATYSFQQNLTYLSGAVNIRSSGIQADDYTIEFCFVGSGIEAICPVDKYINISILTRIPPELPETQETPPEFYDPIDADQFYLDFSDYDTPTALYNNLKNAIQPIFTTIGSNLIFFTSRFDSETAKDTGEKTGEAILLVRSYSSNLNTFFNDLPVSEFLLFYLTLLIVVIVFRIIKNLINLIKP